MKLAAFFVSTILFAGLQSQAAIAPKPVTGEDIARTRLTLASQLIQAYDLDLTCEVQAYPTEINNTIRAALDQARPSDVSNFIKRVPAKSKVRSDLAFLSTVGLVNLFDTNIAVGDLAKKIVGTKFYAFGNGAYGSPKNVTLHANGVAEVNTLEVLEVEPWTKWNTTQSTWSVVTSNANGAQSFRLVLEGTEYEITEQFEGGYEIWLQPADRTPAGETDFARTLSTSPSLCEAYY